MLYFNNKTFGNQKTLFSFFAAVILRIIVASNWNFHLYLIIFLFTIEINIVTMHKQNGVRQKIWKFKFIRNDIFHKVKLKKHKSLKTKLKSAQQKLTKIFNVKKKKWIFALWILRQFKCCSKLNFIFSNIFKNVCVLYIIFHLVSFVAFVVKQMPVNFGALILMWC